MNRIDRLFGISTLLQSRKYVTVETIADKFGISVRTVYRDIKALCEQGIPISFQQDRGYFIVQGYFLKPVSFSREEANAMLLMETLVQGFGDISTRRHYTAAMDKIKANMRGIQKDQLEYLNDNTRMQLPECFRIDFDYLSTLQTAIADKKIISLSYQNKKGESGIRAVEPIGLVFYALSWHLIAWCHKKEEYRDFKVSRMLQVQCTGQPFNKADHIPLSAYMQQIPVTY